MIALYDSQSNSPKKQQKRSKSTVLGHSGRRNSSSPVPNNSGPASGPAKTPASGPITAVRERFNDYLAKRSIRKNDRIAIVQLLQLDESLLRDIGLTRDDVLSVRDGSSSMDALVKRSILTRRDNGSFTK